MDHTRVDITSTSISCGVQQLSRISEDTFDALFAVSARCNHPSRGDPAVFFIASDVTDKETATERFFQLVEKMNLGRVIRSLPQINDKTGNPICVYVWSPDHAKLKEFYVQTKIDKLKSKIR